MNTRYQFEVQLEADGQGGFIYKAELTGGDANVPYGYGFTPFEAILDLCKAIVGSEAE